ncbi:MAG: cadmium-translocating P-type ATPase [Firmicutes bacterium]|nr:cadmium-translocating P-type ATPase [Bacillota bacterium]
MDKHQRREAALIALAAALFVALQLQPAAARPQPLYLLPYLIVGLPVIRGAVRRILRGQFLDENFLITVASIGAFAIGEAAEAVAVMIFYRIGHLFEEIAVGKSRRAISALLDIYPNSANIEQNGEIVSIDPDDVEVGTLIIIRPGERIPIDGIIESGSSLLDTSALTGESLPRAVTVGDEVISGCINSSGLLKVRTTCEFADSTVSRILDMVENATANKAKSENFITRFAAVYTPLVVTAAVLVAVVPPLLLGGEWVRWLRSACTFLVISCPCALVLSVPLSFFGGIGAASRHGVLIKGSNYLEALGKCRIMVLDKTGTLTYGRFSLREAKPQGISEAELLDLAARAERYSDHPLAQAVLAAAPALPPTDPAEQAEEIAGHGVILTAAGTQILAGNARLLARYGVEVPQQAAGTVIHVAENGLYRGSLHLGDAPKPEAEAALRELRSLGVERCVMLTGDNEAAAAALAAEVGIGEYRAGLLPGDKLAQVEQLKAQLPPQQTLAFVGDGINDAPALSLADVGISMGRLGSDAAVEAADIVLMDDSLAKLALAIRISRKTVGLVRQNIVFSLAVKFVILGLGIFGHASMWAAIFADVGVMIIAVLNAMRCLRI